MGTVGTTRLVAIPESLRCSPGTIQKLCDAALAMLGGVAMLWGQNVHDRDRLAGKILEGRCERAASRKQLAFALCKATLADQSDLAPEHVLVGDRGVLKRRELGAAEIGFDLIIFHPR